MVGLSNVQKNASFIHKFGKNLPTVGGRGSPLPHPPPPRSVASLPRFAPVDKSWLHHCYCEIAKMHKGAMTPPPPHWSASKTKEERKEKGKISPEKKFIRKRTRVGNWSMPLHKLPLIKVSNVQENSVFRHKFLKNLSTVGGENPLPHPPPARSLRSLALAPRWQILAVPPSLA